MTVGLFIYLFIYLLNLLQSFSLHHVFIKKLLCTKYYSTLFENVKNVSEPRKQTKSVLTL